MQQPGPAQLDLIRRYARTLRELHADAMRAQRPRIGAKPRPGSEPLVEIAKTMAADAKVALAREPRSPGRRPPASPAA